MSSSDSDRRTGGVLAVDLGHHQVFGGRIEEGDAAVVPLGADRDGLVVRWCNDRGVERLIDRIDALARLDPDAGAALAADLATLLVSELGLGGSARVALSVALSSVGRTAIRSGFAVAGVGDVDLVDRPVAAFAHWLDGRSEQGDGLALVVDDDGGRVSALLADESGRRLHAVAPIGDDRVDDVAGGAERLRRMLIEGWRSLPTDQLVVDDIEAAVVRQISTVVVSGGSAGHPRLHQVLDLVVPEVARSVVGPERAVLDGLLALDRLAATTAAWPTVDLCLDGALVRPAGWRLDRDRAPIIVAPGAVLGPPAGRLVTDGDVVASGIVVPSELGPFPVLFVLPDGRLLLRGERGQPPLTIQVAWPVPGVDPRAPLRLTVVGRRRPRFAGAVPAAALGLGQPAQTAASAAAEAGGRAVVGDVVGPVGPVEVSETMLAPGIIEPAG